MSKNNTLAECLGGEDIEVRVEVHVSVTIFNSDFIRIPGLLGYLGPGWAGYPLGTGLPRGPEGLPGLLGGFFTKFWRSVLPGRHALIGT